MQCFYANNLSHCPPHQRRGGRDRGGRAVQQADQLPLHHLRRGDGHGVLLLLWPRHSSQVTTDQTNQQTHWSRGKSRPTVIHNADFHIFSSLMYKKVADAQYRSKLSNELMMYHMKVGVSLNYMSGYKVFDI